MDMSKLRQQVQIQTKEKEEWMQKFYAQLTESEVRDRELKKTLGNLESEVQRLTEKAEVLSRENKALRAEKESQRLEINSLRSQLREGSEAERREQSTYKKELEAFAQLLGRLNGRIHSAKSPKRPSSKANSRCQEQISAMRTQLDLLSSSLLALSPEKRRLSASRKSAERLKTSRSPLHLQEEIEDMITRVELRLQRAKQLTQ